MFVGPSVRIAIYRKSYEEVSNHVERDFLENAPSIQIFRFARQLTEEFTVIRGK